MDNILDLAKAKALSLLRGDKTPMGMGDVKEADVNRSFGYTDPMKEEVAKGLHDQRMSLANINPISPMVSNVTPQDVNDSSRMIQSGMNAGMTYKLGPSVGGDIGGSLESVIQTPTEKLLGYVKSLSKTPENLPKIREILKKVYGSVTVK